MACRSQATEEELAALYFVGAFFNTSIQTPHADDKILSTEDTEATKKPD